jgi:hypothetical protein
MKYITTTYNGRLGNVLFEVASVIGLGKKLGRKPSFKNHPSYDEFLSKVLEKYPYFETKEIESIGNIYENSNYYEFYESPVKSNMLNIVGYLQTPLYFENIKDEIKDLFRPSESLSSTLKSKYLYENLVAIHIRGTDYKSLENIYEQLGVNYYSKAIKYFKNKNPLTRFVIFTDDETYAKSIINSILDSDKDFYEFADQSSYKDTEVIHWLGMFKNIIIANSSYSWWGAYLGNAEEVIAPLEWYSTKPPSDWADIYPEGWITISNKELNINLHYDHSFWNIFKGASSSLETVITNDKNYEKKGKETVFMITDEYIGESLANINYMLYTKPFNNKYPDSFNESKPQVWVGDINTTNGYRRLQNTILTLIEKPNLSILLPVYNTPSQYLRSTITSIYKQTYRKWEVLLMDDGSTKLDAFYDRFSWRGILIIRCGTNYKLPTTLNRGIMMSRTDLIARMDSDDIMLKNRLEVQVNFMNSHPNVGVSGCQMNIFSVRESEHSACRFTPIVVSDNDWNSPRCLVAHPSVIYRRNILKKVDYYSEWALHYEDLEMWSKLYKIKEPLVNIPNVLMLYRLHPESVSRVNNTKQREESVKLFNNMRTEVIPALRGGKKGIRKYDVEKGN